MLMLWPTFDHPHDFGKTVSSNVSYSSLSAWPSTSGPNTAVASAAGGMTSSANDAVHVAYGRNLLLSALNVIAISVFSPIAPNWMCYPGLSARVAAAVPKRSTPAVMLASIHCATTSPSPTQMFTPWSATAVAVSNVSATSSVKPVAVAEQVVSAHPCIG